MLISRKLKVTVYWNLIILSFLTFSSLYAQTNVISTIEPEQPLSKDWEDWLGNRPVTGGGDVRVGLISDNKNIDIKDASSFFVLLPESVTDSLGWLHVIIKSLDGKYQAKKLFYNIEKDTSRILRLKLPTSYKKQLSKYKTSELSILTMLKKTRNSQNAVNYLASSWNSNIENNGLILNINSRTPIKLLTTRHKRKLKELKCEEVKNGEKKEISFNFRCYIPREHVNDSTKIVLIKSKGRMKGTSKNLVVPIILE